MDASPPPRRGSEPASEPHPGLAETSDAIRHGRVSPVQVVSACLDRIARLQPRLNAFITVTADAALEAAAIAAREIHEGRWRGPLHGIPIGIKDFYDTAGVRTTAAFEHFKNRVPAKDAVSVARLKQAGAIVIGKTNMHTLGMGTTGLDSYFGPVKNPRHEACIPGGSSSGSAAAVASGLCFATLDTDAIGSCRLPAACCGVVGYKGSSGLIDMAGILDGEPPPDDAIRWLSHAGITTRSVADTRLMLDVLAGVRTGSASRPLRIGIASNYRVDEEVARALEAAAATIRRLGYAVRDVPAPLTDFRKGIGTIEADRRAIGAQAFADIDVLALPTTTTVTPTVEEAAAARNPTALSPALTMFANYYGLPAISVPCGVDRRGLPLGLQLVARSGDDAAVLQMAAHYEDARTTSNGQAAG